MSYESEVIADVPALFWRQDRVGSATNGDEITDLSGNDLHGTLEFIQPGGTPEPYGYASPIETDASSREFRGFNEGVFENTKVARIGRESDSLIEPTGNFTLEGWLRLPQATGGSSQFGTIMQPTFGRTGSMFIYVDNFDTLAGCVIDSAGTGWLVINNEPVVFGQSYYVVLTRSGNALSLRVNDAVKDITTITSGLPNKMDAPGTFLNAQGVSQQLPAFFAHPFQVAGLDARYDEIAFYTYDVSGARLTAHYEAALSATLLSGYSNVVPSAVLYSDEEKSPIHFPHFRHNWDDPLIERIFFASNNVKATSGKPEGCQPTPTPRREIEISQVLRDDSERRTFRAKLWAHQDRKWFVPMREDFEQLSSSLSSGTNSIPVSPEFKDYDEDSWIGLRELNDAGQIVKSEVLEIQALNAPTGPIITKTNTVNSYQPYLSYTYPVRRAILERSVPIKGHTDSVEDLTVVARLLAEDEKAVPNRITPWTPTILRSGYEVFDPAIWTSNDWSDVRDYDVDREGQEIDFEVGAFETASDTVGAEESFSYRFPIKGRDKHSEFLGWFYAREGSLNYLWVPTMQKDFKIVSVLGTALTVEGIDYSENYALAEARRDLAFVYNDNTMVLRKVLSFSGSPNETLVLDFSVPTQTNLRSISLLKFCQMDGNTLEIAKYTDDVWRFAWRFRELLFTP